jgi:hypothetical protein
MHGTRRRPVIVKQWGHRQSQGVVLGDRLLAINRKPALGSNSDSQPAG